ncbi:hypothetical protein CRUP_030709 [Coryphaenoides rupestris]|nr:hypothetical protein CRUP_030709 [Coryphaenoides rupestris]
MTNSCQTFKNLLLGLLVVWGVASLVIIIMWASKPAQDNASPCSERLQEVQEKLEGAKVVWGKNKVALEMVVVGLRENQTRQQEQIQTLLEHLALSNRSLETCHQEQVVLNGNMSLLEQEMERQKEIEANLTAHISLQRGHIEAMQQNVTQETHRTAAAQCKEIKHCSSDQRAEKPTPSFTSSSSSLAAVLSLTLPTCWGLHLLTSYALM